MLRASGDSKLSEEEAAEEPISLEGFLETVIGPSTDLKMVLRAASHVKASLLENEWIEVLRIFLRSDNVAIKQTSKGKEDQLQKKLLLGDGVSDLTEEPGSQENPLLPKKGEKSATGTKAPTQNKVTKEEIEADIAIPASTAPQETFIEPKAYLKMVLHASKYAGSHLPRNKWVEVIGILTGVVENRDTPLERIVVKDAFPIGHGDAISVVIQNPGSMERVYREKNGKDFIIGWYHSHPSYGPFMSEEDRRTQLRYQTLWADSIAIVLDPTMVSRASYGFEIFRLKRPGLKQWETLPYIVRDLAPGPLPELVEFLRPLIGGDALFLEYE
jgi:proteasome lid subunit RPN8/RPN11